MLRKIIREKILEYLNSDEWNHAVGVMSAGRKIMHAHVYADSILHPDSIAKVMSGYFAKNERHLERKIKILSHGKGYTNVYYIQPRDMCHFEVFLNFNEDVVIEPMNAEVSRSGRAFDSWDGEFMEEHYKRFAFRPTGSAETAAIEAYFRSDAWKQIYGVMAYDNERSIHSHCIVETSLHPEKILPIGKRILEARGWDVDRAISLVFGLNGYDQGKITFLVRKPEIVLELEWEYNPDVVIQPAAVPIARITTDEMVRRDMEGIPYLSLTRDDLQWLQERYPLNRDLLRMPAAA